MKYSPSEALRADGAGGKRGASDVPCWVRAVSGGARYLPIFIAIDANDTRNN